MTPRSLLAAVLFAASTSFLYYARHLFPYDVAMTFGLLALMPPRRRTLDGGRRWRAGGWAACAFFAYFGYWALGGAACVVCVLGGSSGPAEAGHHAWRRVARRRLGWRWTRCAAVGTYRRQRRDERQRRIAAARVFVSAGESDTQGNVAEGWRLPFDYLLARRASAAVVVGRGGRYGVSRPGRHGGMSGAARVGMIGLLFVYGALAIPSTALGVFVVYGRLARQLVPFFCLVTAAVLVRVSASGRRCARLIPVVAAAIVLQAAVNARQVFAQQFPPEFIATGEQAAGRLGASRVASLYTEYIYPPVKLEVRPIQSMMSASHPLQFVPYQYEGFTPEQRRFLRSTDMRMRILVPAKP